MLRYVCHHMLSPEDLCMGLQQTPCDKGTADIKRANKSSDRAKTEDAEMN